MKIHFPVITNLSGADIHFELLSRSLQTCGVEADLRRYPHLLEFVPYTTLKPFFPRPNDADIIHTKAEYGWAFAERPKPLVVVLAHSVFDPVYEEYKGALQRLYHNLKLRPSIAKSFARADRIVTVSRFSAQRIAECFPGRPVQSIHEGLDTEFFRPADSAPLAEGPPIRLLFVGNCTRRKGFDLLPRILNRLGSGFVLEYTSGLRSDAGSPPHPAMRPLGRLSADELRAAYQRSDILLFPSRLEGFGRPVAEAMACGKPVVCTDYASLPELVDDGLGGYLCPRDDVEGFTDRIRRLATDHDLRGRMGLYNRAKIERQFSLTRWAQDYLALYRELL